MHIFVFKTENGILIKGDDQIYICVNRLQSFAFRVYFLQFILINMSSLVHGHPGGNCMLWLQECIKIYVKQMTASREKIKTKKNHSTAVLTSIPNLFESRSYEFCFYLNFILRPYLGLYYILLCRPVCHFYAQIRGSCLSLADLMIHSPVIKCLVSLTSLASGSCLLNCSEAKAQHQWCPHISQKQLLKVK